MAELPEGTVTLEFRVLGPLEVLDGGRPLRLGSVKQRTLLAALLVNAGQVVSSDRLIDILWPDRPPVDAVGSLQTYVSRLRRVLDPGQDPGSGVLVNKAPGYLLRLESEQLDAACFEALIADARVRAATDPVAALKLFTDALGMWRGPALAEFADAEFARAEATRLEGLRLAAADDRADLRLALGEHSELIGELQAIVELYPLQERPRAQLMVALYRAGRQVDALAAFQDYRGDLAEMGLEPSAELQALETSIVRQEPELGWQSVRLQPLGARDAGRGSPPALPEGVLTFLLTDVEGSTALWDTAPAAMAEALARHELIIGECVAAHGGTLVKSKGEGDSTLSVFPQATAAVNAAVELQRALVAEEWNDELDLKTRVALHTGEAQLRDDDYFGGTLNRAARIRSLAAGGQILCSRATADLVADTLPEQVELVALGTHTLKGLRRDEALYALTHPDLPDLGPNAFPPSGVPRFEIPLPARLAITTAPFTGRDHELGALQTAFQAVCADDGRRVVLIGGEPGIGKTTLASQAARAAHADGAVVLYGRCDEEVGIPYQPWVEAVTHLVRHIPEPLLSAHVAARGGELARLIPELEQRVRVTRSSSIDPEAERHLLFGAVVDLLERASRNVPILLAFDDLHWADWPSVHLLRHVVNAPGPLRLLLINTYRDNDLSAEGPCAALLAALHREPAVERISLGGLDAAALGVLLEATAGHSLDAEGIALRDALAVETDGNPFFVTELLRHLAETGMIVRTDAGQWIATRQLDRLSLPTSVREVIGHRVARLGDPPGRVLALASVIGREFDVGVLADVSELHEETVLDALDVATSAALVQPAAEGLDRYSFVHALIEHTIFDSVSPARRRRTHARIAAALEARVGADPGDRASELARHWLEAGDEPQKAFDYCIRAGDQALDRLAPADALTWFSRASALADDELGESGCCAEALYGLGVAQRDVGDARYRQTLLDAAHRAEELGDDALLARCGLANTRGLFSAIGELDADRASVLETAAARVSDTTTRARLLALLASEHTFDQEFATRRLLAGEAMQLAQRSGDDKAIVEVTSNVYSAIWVPETHRRRLELTAAAIDLVGTLDDPVLAYWTHVRRAFALIEDCDLAGYDRHEAAFTALADHIGQPVLRWYAQVVHATRLILGGNFDDAEPIIDETFRQGTELGQPDAITFYAATFGTLRMMQGRGGEVIAGAGARAITEALPTGTRAAVAVVQCELGDTDEARRTVEELCADNLAAVPYNHVWLLTLVDLARVAARCDMRPTARTVIERLRPYAGLFAYTPSSFRSTVDLQLGALSRTLGNYDDAFKHLDRAAELHSRIQAPIFATDTDLERARTFLARGEPGDRARALKLLTAVERVAGEHGFPSLRQQAEELKSAT